MSEENNNNNFWRNQARQNLDLANTISVGASQNAALAAQRESINAERLSIISDRDNLNAHKLSIANLKNKNAKKEVEAARIENENVQKKAYATRIENENLQKKAEEVRIENEHYRSLLARPLIDILKENTDLKKAYEKQQEVLRSWVISQEAFRSMSKKFRLELGISDEKIKEIYQEEKEKAPESLRVRGDEKIGY